MSKQQSLFRFLGGKRPLSESANEKTEKRKEQKKNYEDCRDRKFLPQWLETFSWLTYKEDSGLMFCKVRFKKKKRERLPPFETNPKEDTLIGDVSSVLATGRRGQAKLVGNMAGKADEFTSSGKG